MLELKHICKDYTAGDNTVHALKNVDLSFRKSEFVSILGPSGCGKTTMLNIIGGLDQYSHGDLIINGKSTKDFNDRDWDSYRNHSVGFIFQSYNLIPHQSVLQNVELALSLSGVSKTERRKRAKEALELVGLGNQFNKKPGEMSGGQMQRVAIARAIVNNPDIILADEPTGALDTETSVQVMEILKEISKDRLVVMVTHNPELAETYSTRIIRMLDGEITNDSMPLSEEEITSEQAEYINSQSKKKTKKTKKEKKPSMSFSTSFSLSLKNLFTKKGRTILTSFAGSIGIIGIALILAVSQGATAYIDTTQEETLSSYPLTLESQHTDMSSLLSTFMGQAESSGEHANDAVYQKSMMYDMVNALNNTKTNENDLESFKAYIEKELKNTENTELQEAISGIQYTYNRDMLVFTKSVDGKIIQSDTQKLLQDLLIKYFGMDLSSMMSFSEQMMGNSSMMSFGGNSAILWQELLSGKDGQTINPLLEEQYDVIYGNWPKAFNEIVVIVDENNEIDDMTLYALGLKSEKDIDALAQAAFNKENIDVSDQKWSYKDICNMKFRTVFNADCYIKDNITGVYKDLREDQTTLKLLYENGTDLVISGIIRPNKDASSTMLKGTIGYTYKLTEYMIKNSAGAVAIKEQLDNPHTDIFTGLPFKENTGSLSNEEKANEFVKYINSLDNKTKAETYIKIKSLLSSEDIQKLMVEQVAPATREDMIRATTSAIVAEKGLSKSEAENIITKMSDEDIKEMFTAIVIQQESINHAAMVKKSIANFSEAELVSQFEVEFAKYPQELNAKYYDEILVFSNSSLDNNLQILGYVNLNKPSTINLYSSSFKNKDVVESTITKYNKSVPELQKIVYTDYVGLMMSSITLIINAITYVLIAFVAVSLVVSSIMIGVITLISVQERTKEIGILRAIGASKKNVSRMFNAETIIIGFTSGTLGVLLTYLLCIPINIILHSLTGIETLSAYLPVPAAIVLVAISVVLTLFAGIIPSRSAAKKDPVVALRTE